jgi:glycosyltransferase involved in cell wall biosynthesis
MTTPAESFRPVIVIPVYNHRHAIARTIEGLAPYNLPCITIDDGSNDGSGAELAALRERFAWVTVIKRGSNGGKGAAIIDGIRECRRANFTHALLIDADGQHDAGSVPEFLRLARENPSALILGAPQFDSSAPRARKWGREISNALVWIQTLSFAPRDALCGFRLVPLNELADVITKETKSLRMQFDIESLVRSIWRGVQVINVPTKVVYPLDGVSHFRYLEDNMMIAVVHIGLILGMVVRSPMLIGRRLQASGR